MDTPTILIVEDEHVIFQALAQLLRAVGYQVVHGPDSLRALAWLTVHTPALVVLDLWVPVLGGKRLVQEVQARPGPATPVLILTRGVPVRRRSEGAWGSRVSPQTVRSR